MQKIVVEKDEAVADLIERILEVEEEEIRLVVPKKSHLLDSKSNLRLIAREAKTLNKNIVIESVDESVLEAAKASGLTAIHPLFDENSSSAGQEMSDIVPHSGKGRGKSRAAQTEDMDERAIPLKVQHEEDDGGMEEEAENTDERYDTLGDYREKPPVLRWGVMGGALIALILLALWGFGAMFGKAEVSIRFNRTPWTFSEPVAALTSVKDINTERNIIPGQLFEEEKSLAQSFPASGRANVADKAQGTITIVNAYSSDPQTLVVRTRFEAPSGKVYRLDSQVVVPGAKVENGKITPQSIKAQVTADEAGPEYNSGKVDKLTIPGFKGSPKYDGFYGMLENGIQGGAVGERAVATEADMENARVKVGETLKSAFQTTFLGSIPSDIKVLDNASAMQAGKVNVNRTAGSDGKFTATGTALFEAFGFREKDLNTFLAARAGEVKSGSKIIDTKFAYKNVTPDFLKKELKFSLEVEGNLVPDFDPAEFSAKIAGQKKADAQGMILGLNDLSDARIKVWPGWLRSLPSSSKRITITVE